MDVSPVEEGLTGVGVYGADSDPVDFILGITFEIWEEGGTELIRNYYADDVTVFALDGVVTGAARVIDATRATLAAYPDRRLLGENVVWSAEAGGFLSSHRILSRMTNTGPSLYGDATGRAVWVRSVADCLVEDGRVVREWIVRDALALVRQLGFDPVDTARTVAARMDATTRSWIADETKRLGAPSASALESPWLGFAQQVLAACWSSDEPATLNECYSHYAVLHPSPIEFCFGRDQVAAHYGALRRAFGEVMVTVDHIAFQPSATGDDLAVRWGLVGNHIGDYEGLAPTGQPVFILGVSHYRIVNGRIAAEWTTFNGLGVMAQLID